MLQEHLLDPVVLVEKEKLIDELRAEKNRIDQMHRQLLIRYTTIKFTIDASLKQLEAQESAEAYITVTGSKLASSAVAVVLTTAAIVT